MKRAFVATLAATIFVAVSPAFANPGHEAEHNYAGWNAAQQSKAGRQFEDNQQARAASWQRVAEGGVSVRTCGYVGGPKGGNWACR
jgi:hypothetical protein